ncbi:hypothetical protein [uncultured Lacinutrix sp.]|uniref:hypothetical protein n=1 Tax=uncultured Lacinutrix sp. TaxID=574032 RepID=UPI002636F0E4|nr:hypothetical protein [uncultured Lacinutrix sp.]
MIKFIIITVVVVLLTIGIVKLIDKYIPAKFKRIVTLALWALIFFLGYITFMSVYKPIKFNQVKEKRYAKVIENLVDIRDSQLAYKEVNGKFTGNYSELVNFIENGKFAIIERRDSSVIDEELTKAYGGVETRKEITIIDTLDFVSVKDSLFKNSNRYKTMMNVPFGKEGTKFTLKAGTYSDEEDPEEKDMLPVFEAMVLKKDILHDQEPEYILQENQVVSVDEINGDAIKVGSMEEVKVNGNWPKLYDPKAKK